VPVANVGVIIQTLKKKILDASASLRKMFRKFDLDFSGAISFAEFQMMLNYYSLGITKYEAITLFKAFEDTPGFMSYEVFMRAFDRAEYTVNSGRDTPGGAAADEMQAALSHAELDALIDEAKGHAKVAAYHTEQEVLLSRIARALKSAKTAQSMHYQAAERALLLLNSDTIQKMVRLNKQVAYTLVVKNLIAGS
jgi:hypothetical protein